MSRSREAAVDMKIMDTATLRRLDEAVSPRGHRLSREVADLLDPDGWHIVTHSFLHNDAEVRARMLVKLRNSAVPAQVTLDIPLAEFNKLPVWDVMRQQIRHKGKEQQ